MRFAESDIMEKAIISMNEKGAILGQPGQYAKPPFLMLPGNPPLEEVTLYDFKVNQIPEPEDVNNIPEDYGKELVEVTQKKVKAYTFYCVSEEWDDSLLWTYNVSEEEKNNCLAQMNQSGDGSKENPWRNVCHALKKLKCLLENSCVDKFLLVVSGYINYTIADHSSIYNNKNFFGQRRLIIDFKDAEIHITPFNRDSYGIMSLYAVFVKNCIINMEITEDFTASTSMHGLYYYGESTYSPYYSQTEFYHCQINISSAKKGYLYGAEGVRFVSHTSRSNAKLVLYNFNMNINLPVNIWAIDADGLIIYNANINKKTDSSYLALDLRSSIIYNMSYQSELTTKSVESGNSFKDCSCYNLYFKYLDTFGQIEFSNSTLYKTKVEVSGNVNDFGRNGSNKIILSYWSCSCYNTDVIMDINSYITASINSYVSIPITGILNMGAYPLVNTNVDMKCYAETNAKSIALDISGIKVEYDYWNASVTVSASGKSNPLYGNFTEKEIECNISRKSGNYYVCLEGYRCEERTEKGTQSC